MENKRYVEASIKGMEREQNKDRIFVQENEEDFLAILFDGVSSANEANEGIDVAIESINKNRYRLRSGHDKYHLADLMWDAHQAVIDSSISSPFTTYSAVFFPKASTNGTFSNLGDSRIYEVTPQYVKQLSTDDNLIHNKNVVTRYLGMLNLERHQIVEFALDAKEKRVLLCSDGFYSILEQNLSRFHEVLNFKRSADITKALSQEIRRKNSDDSSYILIF